MLLLRSKRCDSIFERLVGAATDDRWTEGGYENDWTTRELLAHIASTGRAGLLPPWPRSSFSVGSRDVRCLIRPGCLQVHAADDALLSKQFRAPWGIEGALSDVIIASLNGHLRMHLADLEAAPSGA